MYLSYMPLYCDINFATDIESGTKPIAIPPYMMASTELKELKEQLQDLLSKRFIRSNVSPWGSHVSFVKRKDAPMHMCINYDNQRKSE